MYLVLAAQLLAALLLNWLLPFDFLAILSIIWVSLLPHLMTIRQALLLTFTVLLLWFGVDAYIEQRSLWVSALLYGCFHLFALLIMKQANAEQTARKLLEQKHQQLVLTQQLLKATSEQQERTRIARDLHDVVGHHLTGLIIHLQVAEHQCVGEAQSHVAKCQQIARLLLSDVREAVSTLRQHRVLDIQQAVAELGAALPGLKLVVDWQVAIPLTTVTQAEQLLMIIQEALTNSLRHSGASEFYLQSRQIGDRLELSLSDNGLVDPDWQPGHGLTGMAERAAVLGASLHSEIENGHLNHRLVLASEIV